MKNGQQVVQPETILIIEDDPAICSFLAGAVLEPAGYRVIIAKDGRKGLQLALSEGPDAILLDLVLPTLNGLDLLTQLRQGGYDTPTIVLTAHSSKDEILQAFRLGARDFLQKPFGIDQVQSALRSALAEERLRREKEKLTQAVRLANQRLKQQVQNWMALNRIARAIISTLDESEVLHRVMVNVNRILQVEAGSLLLIDEETGKLEFVVTLQGDATRFSDIHLQPGQGIAGWVAEHGQPLSIPDARKDSRFCAHVDETSNFETRSILCVPLKVKDQVIGVLEVINKQSESGWQPFSEGDQELLMTLASWVSVAVENARLSRLTQDLAATRALRQIVIALAHHINNRLMAFSLDLDGLEWQAPGRDESVDRVIASARRHIQEISAVVRALDRLEEIRTVPYVGNTEMIDIDAALKDQLHGT
ncbi:MAG: response regulator [Anaerolineae bacterium]|jgi:DNA-binding response OmpR family regulator